MTEIRRVGIRDLKTNLSQHLKRQEPIAVTNNGKTIGIYLPTLEDEESRIENLLENATKTLNELKG